MALGFHPPRNAVMAGIYYFLCGWRLIFSWSLLPFIFLPIVIYTALIVGTIWFIRPYFSGWITSIFSTFMSSWFEYAAFLILLTPFYFIFIALANFIASPFNSILAERTEFKLTGKYLGGNSNFLQDIPRTLIRELRKLCYSLPRLAILFALSFIPFVGQSIFSILMFIFAAWLMAIEYCDYPFDNHKIRYEDMKERLKERPLMCFTFGVLVSFFAVLPIVNLIIMPIAVCGATAMWVGEYRAK